MVNYKGSPIFKSRNKDNLFFYKCFTIIYFIKNSKKDAYIWKNKRLLYYCKIYVLLKVLFLLIIYEKEWFFNDSLENSSNQIN